MMHEFFYNDSPNAVHLPIKTDSYERGEMHDPQHLLLAHIIK